MIQLFDKQTDRKLGEISEGELVFLIDQLEEEGMHDRDYYIDAATVDFLARQGGSTSLITMLRRALGASDGIDIRWDSPDMDAPDLDSADL
jgi:processive 1,2-diacylglycerol beta-glucosyltransferase